MQASGNNYQLIFTMAATVSLASCLAFILLVPSHVRPTEKVPAGAAPSTPEAAGKLSPTPFRWLSQLRKVWNEVRSMGADFYRMLGVVGLYCAAHINESLLEARAIEVRGG